MPNFISEDHIEQALVQRLQHGHGYDVLNCYTAEAEDLADNSRRTNKREVILSDRLRAAAVRLNPQVPAQAVDEALEKLLDRRLALSLVAANEETYHLLRDGIPVEYDDANGQRQTERVRVIDFDRREGNEFLAVQQLWIKGERGFRRPDVLLYINGLPLVFIELKNSNVALRTAHEWNVVNYRTEIPQLFLANAICVLSNALETRVGSFAADWEHYFPWLRVEDEKERTSREEVKEKGTSVERLVEGLLKPERLLDYIENFVLYRRGIKIIAQNHQFIGVNRAYERFQRRKELEGKLGVFWHTQGSGKSFSMIFYARKIFRKAGSNFTFVIVTDRDDLDRQIYTNFLETGTISKAEAAQPKDSEELRKMLGQQKRLVFTLIHKFRWERGGAYPCLSDRDDIIVIVDEAHRTQYKALAENMRAGLKNAGYLAFTGTPLLKDKKTEQWFGGYVSEYNFRQSMDDGATVPLVYKKRVPEMVIQNDDLSEEFYELLEEASLDDLQQAKLEKQFATELEVIRRPDRLDAIAEDIVKHFPARGYLGKGVVICLDKFTAVRMFDRVERLWQEAIKELTGKASKATTAAEKANLKRRLEWMKRVEMAVVVSDEAEEEKKFAAEKLDITRHRKRMNTWDEHGHDIEFNFKDPEHPLQLVFVCAMWLTGFDAPTVSTLYLDKPQKDHTLMQTIARANRVTTVKINGVEKLNGEVIDYYGVFRNMKKALKEYAEGGDENEPVQEKGKLLVLLEEAIAQAVLYCRLKGVHIEGLLERQDVFKKLEEFNQYADILLSKDEWRKGFSVHENTITSLYEACKPEVLGQPVVRKVAVFQYLRGVMDAIIQQQDLDAVSRKISELLDASVVVHDSDTAKVADAEGKTPFRIVQRSQAWDLSRIDFDKLRAEFKAVPCRNIEIADLRAFLEKKMDQMLKQNTTRRDFAQRLQEIIDRYNAGGSSNESYYEELVKFTKAMREEDERAAREGLTEDELEIFDLLKKDKMTRTEEDKVKLAARSLLQRLTAEAPKVLVQDWHKDSQSKGKVRGAVEAVLHEQLPDSYDRAVFTEKCSLVFDLMLDHASHGRKWAA